MLSIRKNDNFREVKVGPTFVSVNDSHISLFCRVQYHDYVSCNSYITPTLVVALNPGLCQPTLEWARTIRSLAAANVPCVFTSYNRDEAALDAQCVEGMGAKIVWQEERNRWTGQRVPSDYLGEELCRFENAFTLGFWGTTGV